ncbi:MAG: hypothetical protein HUK21_00900 [Fibrobacteraceae bacterium]|nr:hypothetical protein [Fibrobacteraceae bacterium]
MASFSYGENAVMDSLLFSGRWDHTPDYSRTSAPAAMVQFDAAANSITFDLEGEAHFRFDIDGSPITHFTIQGRQTKKIVVADDGLIHHYRLIKTSETNPGEVRLYHVSTDKKGYFLPKPQPSNRRIEFIGDSFTVGYGVEGKNTEDGTPFEKTNAAKSFGFLVADAYKADFQINAFSGRGLVRNYGNIVPNWTIPNLYKLTVPGLAEQESRGPYWNLKNFDPQVIVLFVGINDFQGEPPYADAEEFKLAYASFLGLLREAHPGVKFLLLATKVWPNDDLIAAVEDVYKSQVEGGYRDLEFQVVYTDNTALHGHPNEMSQKELANTLKPIIGRLGRWLSR